ncbi:hypothetical protein BDDG_11807 [Blastomyces dermatitidis ATCC 18188]|uniref:Uncharacterized protein n=1 Tax=Ajellomyces dermatitidis (strain ATCC 18188 / CBS 674.68) TaxID=653446 RepID=A0A0J9EKQ5_AJEDA|nr:hypothetical protein BDDG_11807 [Blastomyces dermatitidis ATCC 18188]
MRFHRRAADLDARTRQLDSRGWAMIGLSYQWRMRTRTGHVETAHLDITGQQLRSSKCKHFSSFSPPLSVFSFYFIFLAAGLLPRQMLVPCQSPTFRQGSEFEDARFYAAFRTGGLSGVE